MGYMWCKAGSRRFAKSEKGGTNQALGGARRDLVGPSW